MKQTETYGFPYPECEPPLVKDASQIAQVADLARAVDLEVRQVFDEATDQLIRPPAARLAVFTLPVATTDNLVVPFFDVAVFQLNWGLNSLPDLSSGGMYINKPGWYMAGCHALVSSATAAVLPMVRLTVNGAAASSWSKMAGNYGVLNGRLAALSAVPLSLSEGDIVRMEIKHLAAGSPAWDYRPHLWAVRMVDA